MHINGKPLCDICAGVGMLARPNWAVASPAVVDGPTRDTGQWAHMCQRHLESAGYPQSKLNVRLKAA